MQPQPTDAEIENALITVLNLYIGIINVFYTFNKVNDFHNLCKSKPVKLRNVYDFELERLNKRYANHHKKAINKLK